jgi:hypothetical protein
VFSPVPQWTTLKKVLGVGAMRHWLYLVARFLESILPGAILSYHYSGQWRLTQGCEASRAWIFDGELTTRLPGTESPGARLLRAWTCPEPGYEIGS